MFRKNKQGTVRLTTTGPGTPCVHVDFDGTRQLEEEAGARLDVVAMSSVIAAAKTADKACDWCLWGVDAIPVGEQRAAAFVLSLSRASRGGTVWVVTEEDSGRFQRIVGHLLRSGCVVDERSVLLPQQEEAR